MFARVEMWTKHSAKITLYTINNNFKNLFKEQENKCIKGFQTLLSTLISLFNIMPFIKWESTWHITMPKKKKQHLFSDLRKYTLYIMSEQNKPAASE